MFIYDVEQSDVAVGRGDACGGSHGIDGALRKIYRNENVWSFEHREFPFLLN
jgi:hypothetical protein